MSRLYVCLPPTKLLLRLIERLLAQQIFPVKTTFPSQALGVVQVYSSFFLCCVEEIRKRAAATSRYTPTRSTETVRGFGFEAFTVFRSAAQSLVK